MPKIVHKKTGEELEVSEQKWNDMKAKRLHLNFRVVPEPVKQKSNFSPPELKDKKPVGQRRAAGK